MFADKKKWLAELLGKHDWSWDAAESAEDYSRGLAQDLVIKTLRDELGAEGQTLFAQAREAA